MLVVTRKVGEKIVISDNIVITIADVKGMGRGKRVDIQIDLPRNIPVGRAEKVPPKPRKKS